MPELSAPRIATATIRASDAWVRDIARAALLVWVPVFGSAGARYVFELTSYAQGVVGAGVIIMIAAMMRMIRSPTAETFGHVGSVVVILCSVLLAHNVIALAFADASLLRPLASLAPLAVLLITAPIFRENILSFDDAAIDRMMWATLAIFIIVWMNGLFGFQPQSELASDKAVFPFTEPSHLALAIMPFIVFLAVRSTGLKRYLVLATALGIALSLKNLSLFVGTALAAAACLASWQLVLFLAAGAALAASIDLAYFTDRIDFNYASTNLSTLVYIQGTELAQRAMETTHGWGIGFQQLGFAYLYSPTSDIIYRLSHDDLNLKDGGFTASKIVSEFGIFGIGMLTLYVARSAFVLLMLRKVASRRIPLPAVETFALAVFLGYSVELFVRGAGYFTPSTLIFLAMLPIAWRARINRRPLAS